jgi:hypothetical protein
MELASMLAGEPFSDRPACTCPVTAGLLRAYNDAVDDRRRQTLYGVASEVVDTMPSPEDLGRRAEHLASWGRRQAGRAHWWRRFLISTCVRADDWDALGHEVVSALGRLDDRRHLQVHALVRELLAIGGPRPDAGGVSVDTDPSPAPPSVAAA